MSAGLAKELTEALEQIEELRKLLKQKTEGCRHWNPRAGGCMRWLHHLLEELEGFADRPVLVHDVWCCDSDCVDTVQPLGIKIYPMYLCPHHARLFAFKLLDVAKKAERIMKKQGDDSAIHRALDAGNPGGCEDTNTAQGQETLAPGQHSCVPKEPV